MRASAEETVLRTHRKLGNGYHAMTFGPLSWAKRVRPGQFVHMQLPGTNLLFRRAMSLAAVDVERNRIEIMFKTVGRGTTAMADYHTGTEVNILGPLGNSFAKPRKSESCLLVAGGIGFPPLFFLASDLVARGHDPKSVHLFYGGRTGEDILERTRTSRLKVNVHHVTEDGSKGKRGLVTQALEEYLENNKGQRTRIYSCGPEPMLKAVDEIGMARRVLGQLSLEAPMPCGIGVCLGCVVPLRKGGHARVCCDGPVFEIGEVLL